jgi:hypothetical protein
MTSNCDAKAPTENPSQVKTETETMTEPDASSSVPMRKRTVTAVSEMTLIMTDGVYMVR